MTEGMVIYESRGLRFMVLCAVILPIEGGVQDSIKISNYFLILCVMGVRVGLKKSSKNLEDTASLCAGAYKQ